MGSIQEYWEKFILIIFSIWKKIPIISSKLDLKFYEDFVFLNKLPYRGLRKQIYESAIFYLFNGLIGVIIILGVAFLLFTVLLITGSLERITNTTMSDLIILGILLVIGTITTIVLSVFINLVIKAISAGIIHVLAVLLGGKASYKQTYYSILAAEISGLLIFILANIMINVPITILSIIPFVGIAAMCFSILAGLFMLGIAIYQIILQINALSITHEITRLKAAIAIFGPFIILLALLGVLVFILLVYAGSLN